MGGSSKKWQIKVVTVTSMAVGILFWWDCKCNGNGFVCCSIKSEPPFLLAFALSLSVWELKHWFTFRPPPPHLIFLQYQPKSINSFLLIIWVSVGHFSASHTQHTRIAYYQIVRLVPTSKPSPHQHQRKHQNIPHRFKLNHSPQWQWSSCLKLFYCY